MADTEPPPVVPAGESFRLLVETPNGTMIRTIPSAAPLATDVDQGKAAEHATHSAASLWGMPDFVFRPGTRKLGSGTRELGDGILLVGKRGLVVQVKSRSALSEDPEKEERWIEKEVKSAAGQGAGTIRALHQQPAELTNLRGRTLAVKGADYRWTVVVVIDHSEPPADLVPTIEASKHPIVVLLRRDWEFLFDQLKSTHAVAVYLERVAGERRGLGEEPIRYYEYSAADHAAKPSALPAALTRRRKLVSEPLLPRRPIATSDRRQHKLFRTIMEDMATTRLVNSSEADRLRVISELDRFPVAQRADIGRFLDQAMHETAGVMAPELVWKLRTVTGGEGAAHLGFGVCSSAHNDEVQQAFSYWVQLRHHDLQQLTHEVNGLTTVGVLLTPRHDGRRPYDTTVCAVAGDLELGEEWIDAARELWGSSDDPQPVLPATSGAK